MDGKKLILPALLTSILLGLSACQSYKGDFVQKSEKELETMEELDSKASEQFRRGNYKKAEQTLSQLTRERTVSQLLYQLEQVSVLLMQQRHAEAHKLMMKLQEDMETLTDTQLEEKAQSLWHGEANKVFKGAPHERMVLYTFLTMSFLEQGNYEDALRCVKNGLLADSSSGKEKFNSDFALLQFLGYITASRIKQSGEAQEYLREMNDSLAQRTLIRLNQDRKVVQASSAYTVLKEAADANVLLVIWTGKPTTYIRSGDYKEIRNPVHGELPFTHLVCTAQTSGKYLMMPRIGDIDFQATTQGGRLMDTVLADKASAKKTAEISRNIFFVAGSGLIIASGFVKVPAVQISLLGAGAGCYVAGGVIWIVGSMINSAADIRYWKNLPYELGIMPLKLPPGKHDILISGYHYADLTAQTHYHIQVNPAKSVNVFHLPMMNHGFEGIKIIQNNIKAHSRNAVRRAKNKTGFTQL